MLDEVADAIAAIQEPSALAVDKAEAGLAGDDAFEAGGVRAVAWSGALPVAVADASVMRRW